MRICHIIVGLNVGGAELMLSRLIQSQANYFEHEHIVVSLTDLGSVGIQLKMQGVRVEMLGLRSVVGVLPKLFRLTALIRQINPDIVQTWMYHADLLGGLAARIAGIKKVIWGIRTTDVSAGGSRGTAAVRWLCASLSGTVPHKIVCAAEASRRVHAAIGYCASRMIVVPNGFDLTRLRANRKYVSDFRNECGFTPNDIVIGTLGRFNAAKDQHNFVRAASLLARECPEARFLMIGRNCDVYNVELMDWIGTSGCAQRFVLLGERSDVPVCLAAMDVFCLASRTEGFPNVVGESMAMGVPCVVTDVGDAAMLVADTGIVVPKEDPVSLAHGLARLIAMPVEVRKQLGQNASRRIYEEFSMERARDRFDALYRKLANEKEGGR